METLTPTNIIARKLIGYICEHYGNCAHVRQSASWVGFIIKAIENLPGSTMWIGRVRQLMFDYRGRTFKVRYTHKKGGCAEILEVLSQNRNGAEIATIRNLDDAEDIYYSLHQTLDKFCRSK
jgi:hypothetical protein